MTQRQIALGIAGLVTFLLTVWFAVSGTVGNVGGAALLFGFTALGAPLLAGREHAWSRDVALRRRETPWLVTAVVLWAAALFATAAGGWGLGALLWLIAVLVFARWFGSDVLSPRERRAQTRSRPHPRRRPR